MEALEDRLVPTSLALLSQQFLGGSGNEFGTGIAVVDTGSNFNVYTSGRSDASGGEGILARYNIPYSLQSPTQMWNISWPGAVDVDSFNGVAATATSVYAAGTSYSQTSDTVGGKEQKGITVNFPALGGSANWARQTPAAPGAFSYGGIETLSAVTTAVENGQTVLYVAGTGQSDGSSGGYRLFVSKLDLSGTVLWTRTDPAVGNLSNGLALTASQSNVFVAGITREAGVNRAYLKSYDSNGVLVWSRSSAAGLFNGALADAATGVVYAVGQTNGPNSDFLIEKRDFSGNLIWSRSYDRNGAADVLKSVTLHDGHLFGAGSTRGNTAGGSDGVVLEIDPATGGLVDTTLWGSTADDSFEGIAETPTGLHVVGTTQSFGNGGSDAAYLVYSAPVAVVPTSTTLVATPLATTGGSSVMFRATVAPSPGASGTITLLDNGTPIPGAANLPLSGGVSVFSTATLSIGSHPVVASYSGSTGFAASVSNPQTVVISSPTAPTVVRVTPNGNIPSLVGTQRSRIASLLVVFDQAVQLDANAFAVALHTNQVIYDGVPQPAGMGAAPTSLNLATSDNTTWVVTFSGNTEAGEDGFNSLRDGVYDLTIDATKVHPIGNSGLGMASDSTTTFHRLFGDIDDPSGPNGGAPGPDFQAIVNTADNWVFRSAFNNPAAYKSYLDFNGDGAINGIIETADNFQFRSRFNKSLTWRI